MRETCSARSRAIKIAAATAFLAAAACFYLARWRDLMMPRRDPVIPFYEQGLRTADGVDIAARFMPGGDRGAVIVAHPAVTGQRYAPLVEVAEMLCEHFDVYTFDFRGHGGSGGRLEMNLEGPLEDLRTVIEWVRTGGYHWIGVLGFSLGGMSALLYAAREDSPDAVAAVGAPPKLPDVEPYRRLLPAWSLFLRFLGARFRAVNDGGPQPMDVAEALPDIPLLLVHGEWEAFYPREDLEEMLARMGKRPDLWVIPQAGHTELKGREGELVDWLLRKAVEAVP